MAPLPAGGGPPARGAWAPRGLPVAVPAALLPALALLLGVLATLSGASGLALLQILRFHAQKVREISRKISRELSRELSSRLLAEIKEPRALRPRNLIGGSAALLLVEALRRLRGAVRGSLALMNPAEEHLDAHVTEAQAAVASSPAWGHGLPRAPEPGEWRPSLFSLKDARENLEEIHALLGVTERRPEELTLEQMAEGVRRVLIIKYAALLSATGRYWNEEQARGIAAALAKDCGLPEPKARGGMEEVTPFHNFSGFPYTAPRWLQVSQRLGIALLRPIFLHVWSWESRFVQTPYGPLHVYDARPPAGNRGAGEEEPPLLLQHGMFVTGWSMALLAWLLWRRGRRVIIPDFFDFDHGLSASDSSRAGGPKVRRPLHLLEALMCVVKDTLEGGASELDICGHSFGGWFTGLLAARCQREGLPVRKVVMLSPGGPFISVYNTPWLARFLNDPMQTVDEISPWWMPAPVVKALAKLGLGVLGNANNANYVLGLHYTDYMGSSNVGSDRPTLLLWGDHDTVCVPRRPRDLVPLMRERFPRLEGYWVRRGGHNIQLDSVVAVARAMDEWLRGGSDRGDGGLAEKLLLPLDASLEPIDLSTQGDVWPHVQEAGDLQPAWRSKL